MIAAVQADERYPSRIERNRARSGQPRRWLGLPEPLATALQNEVVNALLDRVLVFEDDTTLLRAGYNKRKWGDLQVQVPDKKMERAKGFEPSTSTLARLRSTRLSYARIQEDGQKLTKRDSIASPVLFEFCSAHRKKPVEGPCIWHDRV